MGTSLSGRTHSPGDFHDNAQDHDDHYDDYGLEYGHDYDDEYGHGGYHDSHHDYAEFDNHDYFVMIMIINILI